MRQGSPKNTTRKQQRGGPRVDSQRPVSLQREYERLRCSKKMAEAFGSRVVRELVPGNERTRKVREARERKRRRLEYELDKIMERLILTMANSGADVGSDAVYRSILAMAHSVADPGSDAVYRYSDLQSPYIIQTIKELLDKTKLEMITAIHVVAKVVLPHIRGFLCQNAKPLAVVSANTVVQTTEKSLYIQHGNDKKQLVSIGKYNLGALRQTVVVEGTGPDGQPLVMPRFHQKDIAKMVLRYASILPHGQQWAVPVAQYEHLYSKFGIRYEGFASPLNSRLISYGDTYFCSLFPDTDAPFGSIGRFFDTDLLRPLGKVGEQHWAINPPYIDSIMIRAAQKICAACEEAAETEGSEFMCFFIMPAWEDSESYRLLSNSPYRRVEQHLKSKPRPSRKGAKRPKRAAAHHFYEYDGKKIPAKFPSIVFVMDTYGTRREKTFYKGICDAMMIKK